MIVAARELPPGVEIAQEDLYAVSIPRNHAPEGAFQSPGEVVGRTVRWRILQNEFVRVEALMDPNGGWGVSDVVPRGLRAVDVPADNAAIRPRNYVDAWWTPPGGRPCAVVQSAFVLSSDGDLDRPGGEPLGRASQHQLLVAPDQALDLAIAVRHPTFRLVVRNGRDLEADPEAACAR